MTAAESYLKPAQKVFVEKNSAKVLTTAIETENVAAVKYFIDNDFVAIKNVDKFIDYANKNNKTAALHI